MKEKMPEVTKCEMTNCCYNTDKSCHAMAISIGDEAPLCDTYCSYGKKGGSVDPTARVGACKVMACMHNNSLICSAPDITVVDHNSSAECATFAQR